MSCCWECDCAEDAAEWEWRRIAEKTAVERDNRLTFAEADAASEAEFERYGNSWLANAARVWARDARERLAPPPMQGPLPAGRGRLGGYTTAAAAAVRARGEHIADVARRRAVGGQP